MAAFGTVAAIVVSWAFNYMLLFTDGLSAFDRSLIAATVLPAVFVSPLTAFALTQMRRARRASRARAVASHRDSATGFLDQTMFAAVLEDRRRKPDPSQRSDGGSLLLIELDALRRINARYGPEWSGAAIALVADAVRRSVRMGDVVGRLDTGDLSVFLPGASTDEAKRVGERILDAVSGVYFAPDGIESAIGLRVTLVDAAGADSFAGIVRHGARQAIRLAEIHPVVEPQPVHLRAG